MQKVIIVNSMNLTPEEELKKRLQGLGKGWKVQSATTSLALHGDMNVREGFAKFDGVARHAYYVTTVVVEKEE